MRSTRTTRTIALLTSGLVAVGTLTACGGADPLTEEDAKEALLSEEDFPLDGFKRGTVEGGVADDETMDTSELKSALQMFGEVDGDCEKALDEMAEFKASDILQEGASAEYTKDDTAANLVIGSAEDGDKLVDMMTKLGKSCDSMETSEGGMTLKLDFEEIDENDFRGTLMSMDAMGQKFDVTMGAREVGDNVVAVVGNGVSKEDVTKVAEEQAKKIEDR
ncbi:hypothetical protein SAMN05445756_1332 [Kytococcus aerolatus]|uniref:Lipoprotein n=1 Tax=Kytococcus aerolatus TaxID=592308 RepID=A0A212THI8_9MICO|nr:hypothetical protein [Kytococcus aerolatus]SNC65453.1 hypothetical protein SAMN05445756_1332 [Kytococcus aerolatus]